MLAGSRLGQGACSRPRVIYEAKPGSPLRSQPRALRAPRPRGDKQPPRGARCRAEAHGLRLAGAGGSAHAHCRRRGLAGRRSQRVEPRKPARALLGLTHATAPSGASLDVRPAVVVPALPPADADDHRGQHPVRQGRRRRGVPRSSRHPLRPLRAQAAERRGARRLLPQQSRARGHPVSPHRARRPRRAERLPGDRSHRRGPLLRQAERRAPGRFHRALCRDRRALRDLRVPPRRSVRAGVGPRGRRSARDVSSPRRGGLGPAPELLAGWVSPSPSDYRGGHGLRSP